MVTYERKNDDMHHITLSIIIPMYNLEKYIAKCLDSIVSQIDKNVEIILIDDGSSDKTKETCLKYSKEYEQIKYFYQENAGVSAARNNGIKRAVRRLYLFC